MVISTDGQLLNTLVQTNQIFFNTRIYGVVLVLYAAAQHVHNFLAQCVHHHVQHCMPMSLLTACVRTDKPAVGCIV